MVRLKDGRILSPTKVNLPKELHIIFDGYASAFGKLSKRIPADVEPEIEYKLVRPGVMTATWSEGVLCVSQRRKENLFQYESSYNKKPIKWFVMMKWNDGRIGLPCDKRSFPEELHFLFGSSLSLAFQTLSKRIPAEPEPEPKPEPEPPLETTSAEFMFEDSRRLEIPGPGEGWSLNPVQEDLEKWPGWFCFYQWPAKTLETFRVSTPGEYCLIINRPGYFNPRTDQRTLEFNHDEARILLADFGPLLAEGRVKCLWFQKWTKDEPEVVDDVPADEGPFPLLRGPR